MSSEDPPALVWNLLLYNSLIAVENFALVSTWLLTNLQGKGGGGAKEGAETGVISFTNWTAPTPDVKMTALLATTTIPSEDDNTVGNVIIMVGMTFAYQVVLGMDIR